MKQVNSAEFFTCKVDVPNSGERMDTSWNSLYVVEFRKDAISQRRISGLCNFDNPCRRRIFSTELHSRYSTMWL